MKLLLIRHAQSEGNVAGVLQGQQDHALSTEGHRQASRLGHYLTGQLDPPTHLYASPLQRTLQTACYCQPKAIALQPDNALLEIHNGVLQGLTWNEAQTQYPQICETLSQSLNWIPIPEAETPELVFARAGTFIHRILCAHANGDRLWVFSHGGILQHLVAQLMGCDRVWGIPIPPTGLFEFEINLDLWEVQGNDRYAAHFCRILQFNTTPHLASS
jgi:broad specificity phosphatase PhoE